MEVAARGPVWLTSWIWVEPNENTVPLLWITEGVGPAATARRRSSSAPSVTATAPRLPLWS